jgi:peptidylprolyl isomerase
LNKTCRAAIGATLALLLLAGCAGGRNNTSTATTSATADDGALSTSEPSASASDEPVLTTVAESVTWQDGAAGAAPTLQFTPGLQFGDETEIVVQEEGTGDTIEVGQRVTFQWIDYDGLTGDLVYSSWDNQAQNITAQDTSVATDPLSGYLVGHKVGVKLIIGVTQRPEDSELSTDIVGVEVTGTYTVPSRAEGEAIPLDDPTLPQVTLDEATGQPSITVVDSDPPTDLVVKTLIQGSGTEVKKDQTITIHYTGWLWTGGDPFDSSWTTGSPATFTLSDGYLITGWLEGLPGQKVGSQVMLVIPPDKGYGEEGSGDTIPGNSTLIFVVDILDAY